MKKFVFIGRGGQGAKSAAAILAESANNQSLNIQAYPEYGPERMGAPVKSYVKISENKVRSFAPITEPDYVLLIDPSLINICKKTLVKDSILIVNTSCIPSKFRQEQSVKNKVLTVDGTSISLKTVGLNKPNVPLIGGLLKYDDFISLETASKTIKSFFEKQGKKKAGKTNIKSLKRGYEEVKT